jgi:lysophospholipase L1-like esterase
MVKPFRVFLLLVLLILFLSGIALLLPTGGIYIYSYKLKYPSVWEFFSVDTSKSLSINELRPDIVKLNAMLDSIQEISILDTAWLESDTTLTLISDTVQVEKKTITIPDSISPNELRSRIVSIEYPDSTKKALSPFFDALSSGLPSKSLIHVLHYGDSQIEGDRITSYLRSRMQQRFGGRGVGLLHLVPHSYQPGSIRQSSTSNWEKIVLVDLPKGIGLGHKFGVLGGYSFFGKSKGILSRGGFNEASVTIQRLGKATLSRSFSRVRLLYGYSSEPFMASVSAGGMVIDAEMVSPTKGINQLIFDTPNEHSTLKLEFKGDESPLFYGISLESKTGVMVDNIALRGSSGTDFTRANEADLMVFYKTLNVRLIILQFGANLVPHVVESYTYYENQLYRQIEALKRAKPDAAILVIGVSDASKKEGSNFMSYPNIEKIRNAQRNAAKRAGAAFWDCYEAMGGQNSMPAWVKANPPLASKDYVHFSPRGANLIAEMFYSALFGEYEKYISNIAKESEGLGRSSTSLNSEESNN